MWIFGPPDQQKFASYAPALSQSHKLSERPGISIKPDLSPEERSTQSLLLKERKILIASGTEQKNIKLLGNALFVNKQKYGIVMGSVFHRLLPENFNTSSSVSYTHLTLPTKRIV